MSALRLRMSAQQQQTTILATQVVDFHAPVWAAACAADPDKGLSSAFFKHRTMAEVFRIPNSDPAVRAWLYTRPADVEAVGEDAFENAAIESSTIFRIDSFHPFETSIIISPTVSNHWLMVPVQNINGITVGLAYLDVLYQRPGDDLRVPPLPVGKFAIEDRTGEVFVTGWGDDIMIVGWIQSIIRCERVRELLMYQAPPNNCMDPDVLLRRNSFYERRKCSLCGSGSDISGLDKPCSRVGPTPSDFIGSRAADIIGGKPLTNIATLYKRFRGAYFGVCLKTYYENRIDKGSIIVPVFVDVRHGLHAVKQRFKCNLHRNVSFSLNHVKGLFGLSPRSSSRVFFLKSSQPVTALPALMDSPPSRKRKSEAWMREENVKSEAVSPMTCVGDQDSSRASSENSHSPPGRTRRRVGVDDNDRESVAFERKRRNRESARKSNQARKERLTRQKEELARLTERRDSLEARRNELTAEKFRLQELVAQTTSLG